MTEQSARNVVTDWILAVQRETVDNRPMNYLVRVAKRDSVHGSMSWALSYHGCSTYDHSGITISNFYRVLCPTSQHTWAQEPELKVRLAPLPPML